MLLLALTETHITPTHNPLNTPSFLHTHSSAWTEFSTKSAGVALISLLPSLSIKAHFTGLASRLLVADISGPSLPRPLCVAVVYAPDSGKGDSKMAKFLNACHSLIPPDVDMLLGDFNLTLRPEDTTSTSPHPLPRAALTSLLDKLSLVDPAYEGAPIHFLGSEWVTGTPLGWTDSMCP